MFYDCNILHMCDKVNSYQLCYMNILKIFYFISEI
jgi:hypothetical protein